MRIDELRTDLEAAARRAPAGDSTEALSAVHTRARRAQRRRLALGSALGAALIAGGVAVLSPGRGPDVGVATRPSTAVEVSALPREGLVVETRDVDADRSDVRLLDLD